MRILLLFIALVWAVPAGAQSPPALSFPVDCTVGDRCWILSFVDLDATDAYTDHRCGARTYAAHKGTDLALIDPRDMANDVAVRAAAPGRVVGTRDGEPDNSMDRETRFVPGKECGNGVRIDHGNGWATQYCHLKNGSIAVASGQPVQAGAVLGALGNSGASETPHLHFQLEKDGATIDPFTGRSPSQPAACGSGTPLWSETAMAAFGPYASSFIRHAGFAPDRVNVRDVQGTPAPDRMSRNSPALILYATIYGAPADTDLYLEILGPDGTRIVDKRIVTEDRKARHFSFIGKPTPAGGWPPGSYSGIVTFGSGPSKLARIATVILE